tara:strand:- start:128 stop:388 length:261 start_codon:yes stop_codon:yes gene_type:complete
MAIENVQQLLTEQLGKNAGTEVFTGAVSGKNFYAVYFPVESAVSAITAATVTNAAALVTTLPAGTTLFMNVTAMTLTSGIAIGYTE